jgi:DNA-binding LytR/AlgR family response regulator
MEKGICFVLVGICDDEAMIRDELVRLCGKFNNSNLAELEIVSFSSGDELLQSKQPIDILFLDIQMKGLNGLKTAEKIREKDESMIIIFLTGYTGFLQAGYRVKAFRYLLKPVNEREFMQTLTEAVNDLTRHCRVVLDTDGETHFIKLKEIIYIEYVNRNTVVRTGRAAYETTTSMSDWETILNTGDFFRVHKAYIVNMEYINEIGKEILLDNGEKVEVAIRQLGKLKKACKAYRRRNAR